MEFTAKVDIEAPLDKIFAEISDIEKLERRAMRRGVQVTRMDENQIMRDGAAWRARIPFRGKGRDVDVRLVRFNAPEEMVFESTVGGLEAQTRIDCVALSRSRTRLRVHSVLMPRTLSARLLVQSLKLGRGRIDRGIDKALARFGAELQDRLA